MKDCASFAEEQRREGICPHLETEETKEKYVALACEYPPDTLEDLSALREEAAWNTDCKSGLKEAWEVVTAAECTGDRQVALSKETCSVLQGTDAKMRTVSGLCAKQSHQPVWACELGLGKVWEDVATKDCAQKVIPFCFLQSHCSSRSFVLYCLCFLFVETWYSVSYVICGVSNHGLCFI